MCVCVCVWVWIVLYCGDKLVRQPPRVHSTVWIILLGATTGVWNSRWLSNPLPASHVGHLRGSPHDQVYILLLLFLILFHSHGGCKLFYLFKFYFARISLPSRLYTLSSLFRLSTWQSEKLGFRIPKMKDASCRRKRIRLPLRARNKRRIEVDTPMFLSDLILDSRCLFLSLLPFGQSGYSDTCSLNHLW